MDGYRLLLNNFGRHVPLSPAEEARVAAAFTPVQCRKREFLLQEGEVAAQTFFVVSGCLRLFLQSGAGATHVLQFAVEDWWITDLRSFLRSEPSRLSIDALEDTTVLQVTREDLDELLAQLPKLEKAFRMLSQSGMAALQQRIVDSLSQSAAERYLSFRKLYGALEARLPQYQIASYIGVTPEFLSALRRRLARGELQPKQ
jgi:CRP-like cAMP-binding protein